MVRVDGATADKLHPVAARPIDADVVAVLRGIDDIAPKPWPVRFKEWQARGGQVEITNARLVQDDMLAVGAGTLDFTARRGALDGNLQVTVVGIEKVLKMFDIERIMSEGQIGASLSALDRLIPTTRRDCAAKCGAGLGCNAGPAHDAGGTASGGISASFHGRHRVPRTIPGRPGAIVVLIPCRIARAQQRTSAMNASDVMVTTVITVGPDASVQEVADLLLQHRISAVPVVAASGEILGIVSEGDLINRSESETTHRKSWWLDALASNESLAAEYVKSHSRQVTDVMTREVITAAPDTPVAELAALLERNRIKRVPIVKGGKVVGTVSRANLLQGLASLKNKGPPSAAG